MSRLEADGEAPLEVLDLLRPDGPPASGSIPEGCTLRFYREDDNECLVALLRAAFSSWPATGAGVSPGEYLAWKLQSTAEATRYHVVAEEGERMIACRFFMLQRVKFGEWVLKVRQGVDTAVHPDFQRRGLMTAMTYPMPDRLREFDADFSVRSEEEALRRAVRYDERRNFYVDVDVLRVDVDATVSRPVLATWTMRTMGSFDDRFGPFFEEASKPFWLIVERTPAYLNWRFADPRSGGFTIRAAERGGTVLGYAVYCVRGGRGKIVDLLALPGRDDVVAALVVDALGGMRNAGASSIECWSMPSHPYRELLRCFGFAEKRRTTQFYCQPMRALDELVAPLERHDTVMHLMSGDTDLV